MSLRLKSVLSLSAPLLLVAFAESAKAEVPPYARVRSISYAGSGCPAGSVAKNISPDLQAFTLLFDQYIAEVGPGVPFLQRRKNCQLNIDLDFPSGWTYTLFTVDTRGYVALEPGVTATQTSSYYFQGQGSTARLATVLTGPTDRNYQARDQLGVSAYVWAPCGAQRSLNINTEVKAENRFNPGGHGLATVDSIDGQFKLIYGISWTRCR